MCGLLALARSTFGYRGQRGEPDLLGRLRALAERWPRYGHRRLHLELRRAGIEVNHKRVYRLYRLQELALRRRTRKRAAGVRVLPLAVASRRNQRWSIDFLSDALASGRRFRVLMVLDDGIRKALALEVDTSFLWKHSEVAPPPSRCSLIREENKPHSRMTPNRRGLTTGKTATRQQALSSS